MSNRSISKIARAQEIPCMLLPMAGHTILVPTTSVAEMASVQPFEEVEDTPDWFMGYYHWRGIKVPVVSLEALNNEGPAVFNMHGRVAVLNNVGENHELPFIAIHTQGIPRMARVGHDDIAENDGTGARQFDLMAVKVGMEELFIPDVAAIERAFVSAML